MRFIYIKNKESYLSIEQEIDYIKIPHSGLLDINGWDIRKALYHVSRSNATIFEWLQSPIVYAAYPGFRDQLWQLGNEFFCAGSTMHHYLGLAKNTWLTCATNKTIKIKHYFYVLRPLLSAGWIANYHQIPPMQFRQLLILLKNEKKLCTIIKELLRKNKESTKADEIPAIPNLQEFIQSELSKLFEYANAYEKESKDNTKLSKFYMELLEEISNKK